MYAEERQQAIADLVAQRGRAVGERRSRARVRRHHRDRAPRPVRARAGRDPAPGARRRGPGRGADGPGGRGSATATSPTPTRRTGSPSGPRSTLLPATGGSVLLDAGTTTARLALMLPRDRQLHRGHQRGADRRPAAPAPPRRPAPAARPGPPHHPGRRRRRRPSRRSPALRADVAFVGTNGLSVGHGLSTPDHDEAATKRAMVAGAHQVVVLADSSKIGQEHTVRFAEVARHRRAWSPTRASTDADRAALRARSTSRCVSRMIVTLTPNPSIDRTVALAGELVRGAVLRAESVTSQAGGKGVNISRAAVAAGVPTIAVLPGAQGRPVRRRAAPRRHRLPARAARRRRPGQPHAHRARRHHHQGQQPRRRGHAAPTSTGSPPPCTHARAGRPLGGARRLAAARRPGRLVRRAGRRPARHRRPGRRRHLRRTARRAGRRPRARRPHLMKPNGEELASLTGGDADAHRGRPGRRRRGRRACSSTAASSAVLATLGGSGAVLVTAEGAWHADPAADHRRQHRRCRRLQPVRLPAGRPARPRARRAARASPSPTAAPPPASPARPSRPRRSPPRPRRGPRARPVRTHHGFHTRTEER